MGPSIFGPLQLLQLAAIFAVHCGKLTVKHGWSNSGRRGTDAGRKGRGSITPEVPPTFFSCAYAPASEALPPRAGLPHSGGQVGAPSELRISARVSRVKRSVAFMVSRSVALTSVLHRGQHFSYSCWGAFLQLMVAGLC